MQSNARPVRNRTLGVPLTDAELAAVRAAAQRAGAKSTAAYMRRLLAIAVAAQ
jgi:hypothetical protein